jgi:hypothetical protein
MQSMKLEKKGLIGVDRQAHGLSSLWRRATAIGRWDRRRIETCNKHTVMGAHEGGCSHRP